MKIKTTKTVAIKLKGKDADHLASALKKLTGEGSSIGFHNGRLSECEQKVITKLSNALNS